MKALKYMAGPTIEDRAKKDVLLAFLQETAYREELKNKFRRLRNQLSFITRRFKSVLTMNKAKNLVLKMQWDITVRKMLKSKKEKANHDMCNRLIKMD